MTQILPPLTQLNQNPLEEPSCPVGHVSSLGFPSLVWDGAKLELLQKHLAGLIHQGLGKSLPLPPLKPLDPSPLTNYLSLEQLTQILSFAPKITPDQKPLPSQGNWLDLFPDSKQIAPSNFHPSSLKDGQLKMKIRSSMIEPSKISFSNAAIGRFFGRRPIVEWLTLQDNSHWNLSKPCLISLTDKGHFIFRFSSKEDKDLALSKSPQILQNMKLDLLPWSSSQGPFEWPNLHPVWIRIYGIPYHCWSPNILSLLASSIGYLLRLDDITASQKLLTFARILVNIDLSRPKHSAIKVDLEGEEEVLLLVSYENLPCSHCLSPGHSESSCNYVPSTSKLNSTRPEPHIREGILGKPPTLAPAFQAPHTLISVDPPEPVPQSGHDSICLVTTQNLHLTESVPPTGPIVSVDQVTINSVVPPSITFQASIPPPQRKTTPPPQNPTPSTGKIQNLQNRLEELPQEIMLENLEKIPAPKLDTSNPFSILENCSFIEPTDNIHFSSLPLSPSQPLAFSDLVTHQLQL